MKSLILPAHTESYFQVVQCIHIPIKEHSFAWGLWYIFGLKTGMSQTRSIFLPWFCWVFWFWFWFLLFCVVFFGGGLVFCLLRAAPAAYGGLIGAVAAGLHESHSNARSQPLLRPTPQFAATHRVRPGMEPATP